MRYSRDLERDPRIQGEARILTKFSDSDLKTVGHDYNWTYWPGGPDATNAAPVALGSGAQVDVGVLTVNKVPKYRVRASFLGEPCLPGERLVLNVRTPSTPVADTTCAVTWNKAELCLRRASLL